MGSFLASLTMMTGAIFLLTAAGADAWHRYQGPVQPLILAVLGAAVLLAVLVPAAIMVRWWVIRRRKRGERLGFRNGVRVFGGWSLALVAGDFARGSADLAGQMLRYHGGTDIFLARFRPAPSPEAEVAAVPIRSAPLAPASVFALAGRPPHNPLMEPDVHPYVRELYQWLGMGLRPADLDPLRRLDFGSGPARGPEAPLRFLLADALVRRLLPVALVPAGTPGDTKSATLATILSGLGPIASRESAGAALSALSTVEADHDSWFILSTLKSLLKMDAEAQAGEPSGSGYQHARDAATLLAVVLAQHPRHDVAMTETIRLMERALEMAHP